MSASVPIYVQVIFPLSEDCDRFELYEVSATCLADAEELVNKTLRESCTDPYVILNSDYNKPHRRTYDQYRVLL
jgi:hypothetical protein